MIFLKRFLSRIHIQNVFFKRTFSVQNNSIKTSFHSSLYFSQREEQFSVAQPAFDYDYLKDVASKLEDIQENMKARFMDGWEFDVEELRNNLLKFAEESVNLKKIKKKRQKLIQMIKKNGENKSLVYEFESCKADLAKVRQKFYELEDIVAPFLLNLPASIDKSHCGKVLEESRGSLDHETASKLGLVSYLHLGYFNHIFQPSIVGPNAYFLTEEGAQTFYAFVDYFLEQFEGRGYELLSGMDLIKSAVVEAINNKNVNEDLFLLKDDQPNDIQRLHLSGEGSLGALVSTFIGRSILKPCKIIQVGSSYEDCISQTHCVSATIVEHKDKFCDAHEELYKLWWNSFNDIGFRCRSFYCHLDELKCNQSFKLIIAVWLFSKREWIPVLELCNYSENIFRRSHSSCSLHLLHSRLDFGSLMKCWLEHFQDPISGNILRPKALEPFYLK